MYLGDFVTPVRVQYLKSLSSNQFKGLTPKPALLEDLDVTASLEFSIWFYKKIFFKGFKRIKKCSTKQKCLIQVESIIITY